MEADGAERADDRDTDEGTPDSHRQARTFLVISVAAALPAWEIGFEWGAFETLNYHRVFAVFVVATVVLATTFLISTDHLPSSWIARTILALPLLYVLADLAFLTHDQLVVDLFTLAIIASFPYTAYVIARAIGGDYFALDLRLQAAAAALIVGVALAGWYVGEFNADFITCEDFSRVGDFVPADCFRG